LLCGAPIFLGKIIALADSFDTMTSDRSYRKGMDMEVAFKELKSLSGIHYDEKVITYNPYLLCILKNTIVSS